MKFLLDSNACIAWLRQSDPNVIAKIQNAGSANIALCSVVIGELICGAERSGPTHQQANHQRVAQLRQQFLSLPFDDKAAEIYGKIRAHLANIGTPIGPNDLMIASIALANNLVLVTHTQ